MPLDQRELIKQIEAKAPTLRAKKNTLNTNLQSTVAIYQEADNELLNRQIEQSKTHRSVGQVVKGAIQDTAPVEAPPENYCVVATDSSPIAPDRHGGMSAYYVINVGQVMLRYGQESDAGITTKLEFGSDASDEEENIGLSGDLLSARSAVLEMKQGYDVGMQHNADLVLHDGPLTLWNMATLQEGIGKQLSEDYYKYLDNYRLARLPIIGYVSNPHSESVINGLRMLRCDKPVPHCGRTSPTDRKSVCHPATAQACSELRGVMDAALFRQVLNFGHRSPAFRAVLREPQKLAQHIDEINYIYLKTSYEIIRLEFQTWLLLQPETLERALAIVLDQCVRGDGYPPVLMEAHESAVLRTEDRLLLRLMLEENGLLEPESEKGRSKRIRGI